MKILIIGCCGFIGYHLVEKLIKNYKVIGIDNLDPYYDINFKKRKLKILKKNKNFTFYHTDITQKKNLQNVFKREKVNIVINLAAQPGVGLSLTNPNKYFNSNMLGFFNILECIKNRKIKHFIFASSSSVYGNQNKYPVNENADITKPLSFYGATKACNEIMAYSYSNIFKIPTTCLRFFTVYGPENRPDMALYKFTKNMLSNKKIDLYNKGNYSRDFTFISDIILSIAKLVKKHPKEKIPFNVFNIGRSKPEKLENYINELAKQLKISRVKKNRIKSKNNNEPLITYSNSKKLYDFINFKPKINIKIGISHFIKWYKNI